MSGIHLGTKAMGGDFYPYMTAFAIFMAFIALAMVRDNAALPRVPKRLFILMFASIIACAVCEATGIFLGGKGAVFRPLICIATGIEFALSPLPSLMYAALLSVKSNKLLLVAHVLFAAHALFELLFCFSGVVFTVDHTTAAFSIGPGYGIFIGFSTLAVVFVLIETLAFSKKSQMRNRVIPWLIIGLLCMSLVVQELNSQVHLVWLMFSATSIFAYLLYCSVIQQTDTLTRLFNRQSYEGRLTTLSIPAQIVYFDLDDFKSVNDTYGHDIGDLCLKSVARAVYETYGRFGSCYRVGGDEFCAIITRNLDSMDSLHKQLCSKLEQLRKDAKWITYVSVGYARFTPGTDPAETIRQADAMMYRYKREHKVNRSVDSGAANVAADAAAAVGDNGASEA